MTTEIPALTVSELSAQLKGLVEASFPAADQRTPVPHQDELPLSFSIVEF